MGGKSISQILAEMGLLGFMPFIIMLGMTSTPA